MCFSKTPDGVWRVVSTFRDAVSAAQTLMNEGIVEKIWVLGGVGVYQVMTMSLTYSRPVIQSLDLFY